MLRNVLKKESLKLKTFIFAYLGGLLASTPAFLLFNDVGASPFRNFDAVYMQMENSILSIVAYFALLWIVPAIGSTIGAKIGGHHGNFRYMYSRGISGQFLFSVGFGLLITFVSAVETVVLGMPTTAQTLTFLMVSQIGCTLGTVWGV